MAFWTNPRNSLRPSEKGQGAVEAIITLPVFLVLSTVLFQTALLCMGQILLQYTAFCTVRTGVVTDGDLTEMTEAAGVILSPLSPALPSGKRSFKVEVLSRDELLQVRVTWNFPLVVPYANTLLKRQNPSTIFGSDSTIPLQASWTLPMERGDEPGERTEDPHAVS